MLQVFEDLRNGGVQVLQVPAPQVGRGRVLVRTAYSLISSGTEKAALDFARKGLMEKARLRPDLVAQVLEKVHSEGIVTTFQKAMGKLDELMPMGYSAAGIVMAVGEGADGFRVGDKVACAGTGYANHAEVLSVPVTLCVKVPDTVGLDAASFVALGSIALQGFRQSGAVVGDFVAVLGLGLVGLLSVGIAHAAGCRVIGLDVSSSKGELAAAMGAERFVDMSVEEPVTSVTDFTRGRGADCLLMTAATDSNQPTELAPALLRDRGTLVVVGVSRIDVPRTPYYKKEIDIRLSRSYGPGRYDPQYEEQGRDYPVGYVRWTEGRNMEAFLDLLNAGGLKVGPLITDTVPIGDAAKAYDAILGKSPVEGPLVSVLIKYLGEITPYATMVGHTAPSPTSGKIGVSVIGAGGFTKSTLMPGLKRIKNRVALRGIVSSSGSNAGVLGHKYGFAFSSSDWHSALEDAETSLVCITTPHNLHVPMTIAALGAGKDVFVEKPLAISEPQLADLVEAVHTTGHRVMVGFNRRFSPLVEWLRAELGSLRPSMMVYRVNAGAIPIDNWNNDAAVGGGRLIGEGCHFIDLMTFLAGARPVSVFASCSSASGPGSLPRDNCVVTVQFGNGAVGALIYETVGDKTFPKERLEVFANGFAGSIDNFLRAECYVGGRVRRKKLLAQDKGFDREYALVLDSMKTGAPFPIDFDDAVAVTRATFAIGESLARQSPVSLLASEQPGVMASDGQS